MLCQVDKHLYIACIMCYVMPEHRYDDMRERRPNVK